MKKIISILLALTVVLSLAACTGDSGLGSSGAKTVTFMYGGDLVMAEVYTMLINEFNKTVGNEQNIKIVGSPKTTGVETALITQLGTKSAPDLVALEDGYFKKFTEYLEDLTGSIDESALDDLYDGLRNRYNYNTTTTTSRESDPLYGVPAYNNATVLYYNKTVLEANGIICISVAKDDLNAFNAGTLKDGNGKTKADYGIGSGVTVPAKGFYRSESPFVPEEDERDGASWVMPGDDEVLIFNDQIAMNWDEIEDLGLICTKSRNKKSESKYGFYTEWWFSYGWSIGGDCLEDMSGDGDWTFALAGDTPNYIVQDGKTYTGLYTGTVYNAGETLELLDILEASKGDTVSYKTDGSTYFHYTVNGTEAKTRDFSAEINDGTLKELPAVVEAFSRFCHLAGVGGLNVCPTPTEFNGSTSTTYFTSGELAILLEQVSNYASIERTMADEFGVAPLPVYKKYTDPVDPDCDAVEVEGETTGHSLGYALSLNKDSTVKDEAKVFINWVVTEGQAYLAKNGYFSARKSDKQMVIENLKYKNPEVMANAIEVARPGDWWYMPDKTWIDTWATPLNMQVRYGTLAFNEYLYKYIDATNVRLEDYKR